MFIVEIYRAYPWFIGSDPITTYFLTSEPDQAIRFPSHEAALTAVSQYFNHHHNSHLNVHRWGIKPL